MNQAPFNPSLFAQEANPQMQGGLTPADMNVLHQTQNSHGVEAFQPTPSAEFKVDLSTVGQPNVAWQYKDQKAADSAREVYAEAAEAIYIGAFMLKLNEDINLIQFEESKKEKVNA